MEDKKIRIFDWYHCEKCNTWMGTVTVYPDGTEEHTCEVHLDFCLGAYQGSPSYQVERENHGHQN